MKTSEKELYEILEHARYAPSVHNTQAWRAEVSSEGIRVRIDTAHMLHDGDPTRRETYLSLGIFCEAICQVAIERGFVVKTISLHGELVNIALTKGRPKGAIHATKLLHKRCSDRSIYTPVTIRSADLKTIEKSNTIAGTQTWASTDRPLVTEIAELTRKAMTVALSSAAFRRELTQHLVMPWSSNKRGISIGSLYLRQPWATLKLSLLRFGVGAKAESNLEKQRWLSASGVVVITAAGDMPKFWFAAGRAYLQASLAIEALGLSQATSAAIVEASNYHEDIESRLHTNQRILAVLRIGKGSKVRHYSPRIDLQSLLLH